MKDAHDVRRLCSAAPWFLVVALAAVTAVAGDETPVGSSGGDASTDQWTRYEPSPAHPFGQPNPSAPPELRQFDFMIGEFDCVDEIRGADGAWQRTDAIWNASYFLNGYGIQDVYWCDTFATSNVRIYDPATGAWRVNFFRAPSTAVGAGQWVGEEHVGEQGRRLVMWSGSPDRKNGSRLTFFDITDDGFRWHSESLRDGVATVGWKSDCKRRRRGSAMKQPAFIGFDCGAAFPLGRRHPAAPAETSQLDFLPGQRSAEDCLQSARYVLNGFAIQTRTYAVGEYRSSLYLYDTSRGGWRVTTFAMPAYSWSVWDGKLEGGELALRQTLENGGKAPRGNRRAIARTADGAIDERYWAAGEVVSARQYR